MVRAAFVVFSMALAAATAAAAAELRVDENGALTELLTGLDQLHTEKFDSGLEVRLYRTSELKRCEAGREAATCPRGQLLAVALVVQGGTGAAMMWRSTQQFGWDFVKLIDSVGTGRNPGSRTFGEAHFEVKDCEETGGALREVHYRLTVTLEAASIAKLPGDGAVCGLK
jgi:hypothetical protein